MLIVHLQFCQTLCTALGMQQQGIQNMSSVLAILICVVKAVFSDE